MKKLICYLYLCLAAYSIICATPKISIITSVYNGNEFIEEFLVDITRQTVFDKCELIIINANSPGSEETVIKKYMQTFQNIVYKRLNSDPGIYGVWNEAIKMSRGEYITNANLDDRLSPQCYEVHMQELDNNPGIMLVYSERYLTQKPHETFEKHSGLLVSLPEFSRENMFICLPGCNPMWRKSLHNKYGFFDESYKSSGDYEMWLRAIEGGAQFKKAPGCYSLCYENPKGLSTYPNSPKSIENIRIISRYSHIWTDEAYNSYYDLAKQIEKVSENEERAWSLALSYYLTAFAIHPNRAEPLIHIAQHYYSKGDIRLTYLFAQRACELLEPEDSDAETLKLYRYTRFDLLGIAAWYVGDFQSGEIAVEEALKYSPYDQRLFKNLQFYTARKNAIT